MVKPKLNSSTKITKVKPKKVVSKTSKKTNTKVKKVTEKTEKTRAKKVAKKPHKEVVAENEVDRVESVVLPINISLRAKSKAMTIASLFASDFSEPARRIAYTAGLCFVLFGSVLSISNSVSISPTNKTAQLIGSDETISAFSSTSEAVRTETSQITVSDKMPKISRLPNVPSHLESDKEFIFTTNSASRIEVYLEAQTTLQKKSLNVSKLENGRYLFLVPVSELAHGDYKIKVKLTSLLETKFAVEEIGKFTVTDSITSVASENEGGLGLHPNEEESEIKQPDIVKEEESLNVKTEAENVVKVRTFVSEFTAPGTIEILTPAATNKVNLYLRKNLSVTLMPLGNAIRSGSKWLYLYNPANTPNGVYELVAKAEVDGKVIVSESKQITVKAYTNRTENAQAPDEVDEDIASADETSSGELKPKELLVTRPLTELQDDDQGSMKANVELNDGVKRVLLEERQSINEMLRNYAVAQQSGDKILISIAEDELTKKKIELSSDLLQEPDRNLMADDISVIISERIASTKKKIEIFEDLRRNANNQQTSIDTDGDGIADFDEINLFKTDPKSADSDGDGITDGIEIARGFNPLDSSPEAVVRYESPKESFALVAEETLSVSSISPVVRFDESQEVPPVHAEIRGKGIPNSFVTLYIFSTPTVMTVKTDSDGSFVYTFENELEDGEHEVYVAVTDNTGEIVAQSNPFRFIKEAQAFQSEGNDLITPAASSINPNISNNPYLSVIGLGILALGLVLLILGFTLKPVAREDEVVIEEKSAT